MSAKKLNKEPDNRNPSDSTINHASKPESLGSVAATSATRISAPSRPYVGMPEGQAQNWHFGQAEEPPRNQLMVEWSNRNMPSPSTGVFGPTSYLAVLNESDNIVVARSDVAVFSRSLQQNRSATIDDSQLKLGAELLLIMLDDLATYEFMATARFDHCHGDIFSAPVLHLLFSSVKKILKEAIRNPSRPLPDLIGLSKKMFEMSSEPLKVDSSMTPETYFTAMPHRWEVIGLLFAVIGSSACLLPEHIIATYSSGFSLERKSLASVCLTASETCLRFCESTGVLSEQLCWSILEHTSLLTLLHGDYGKT
jgi:hypothetical protein